MAGRKIGDAFIRLHPDSTGFKNEMHTEGGEAGHLAGEGFANEMIKRVGELFAGEKLLEVLKGSVERAEESEKLTRATEAVIKSTGGAANVSADQVNELAGKLSNLAGVDDEVIRHGENVILTFTGIKNQVGEGNDIFDQASLAALNLSTALKTDMQSAAILVGKALNDPIRGVTALRREGVQLTDAQTEQIKKFVEVGDVMSAQKIILGELKTEFGGAAEAAATPTARAKVAWQNFEEVLGGLLLPTIGKVADVFSNDVIPAMHIGLDLLQKGWVDGAKDGAGFLQQFGAIAHKVFDDVGDILTHYVWPAVKDVVMTLHDLIGWVNKGSSGAQVFRAVMIGLGAALVAYKLYMTAVTIATKLWAVAQAILDVAMDANPIGLIILAVIALVAGIVYLWTHSAAFRNFFIGMWNDIWPVLKAIGAWFAGPFAHFFEATWAKLKIGIEYFVAYWKFYWAVAKETVHLIVSWIEARIQQAIDNVRAIIARVKAIVAIFEEAFRLAKQAIVDGVDNAIAFVESIPGRILGALGDLGSLLYNAGADVIRGLWNGIKGMGGWLWSHITDFVRDNVPAPVAKLLGLASPSKLFARYGRDTVEGFAVGFVDRAKQLKGLLTLPLPGGGVPALAGAAASLASAASKGRGGYFRFHPDDLRELAHLLAGMPLQVTIDDQVGHRANIYQRT